MRRSAIIHYLIIVSFLFFLPGLIAAQNTPTFQLNNNVPYHDKESALTNSIYNSKNIIRLTRQTWYYQGVKETDEYYNEQEIDKTKWITSNDSIGGLPIKNIRIKFSLNLTDLVNANMDRVILSIPQSPKPYKLFVDNQRLIPNAVYKLQNNFDLTTHLNSGTNLLVLEIENSSHINQFIDNIYT